MSKGRLFQGATAWSKINHKRTVRCKGGRTISEITIRNLLMMQSGLHYNVSFILWINIHAPWHDEAVGYYHGNVRKLLLKRVKILGDPGKTFQYCNYNTSYLGLILERATGKTVSEYLEEKLWSRIMGYEALFTVDSKDSGFEYMPSRLIARAIDYARFGRLFLHQGNWNGEQIISTEWAKESTSEDQTVSRNIYTEFWGSGCKRVYYAYQWWGHTNCDSTFQIFASGNLGQSIYVIPHEETIIVHCGNSNAMFNDFDLWQVERNINYRHFAQAIVEGVVRLAISEYQTEKERDPDCLSFDEDYIDRKGYAYLRAGCMEDALLLFRFDA